MTVNEQNINRLLKYTGAPCISIYIKLNPNKKPEGNRIRWENACNKAKVKISKLYQDKKIAKELLKPAVKLLKEGKRRWNSRSKGLCIFISLDLVNIYQVDAPFEKHVFVGSKFLVSPLLKYYQTRNRFFLLDLNANHLRFYDGTNNSFQCILKGDKKPGSKNKTGLVTDKTTRLVVSGAGMFYGSGKARNKQKVIYFKYIKKIDQYLCQLFSNEKIPLILSGDLGLISLYRKLSNYKHLIRISIPGHNRYEKPKALSRKANRVLQAFFFNKEKKRLKKIIRLKNKSKVALGKVETANALLNKNLANLFIPERKMTKGLKELLHIENLILSAYKENVPIFFLKGKSSIKQIVGLKYYKS